MLHKLVAIFGAVLNISRRLQDVTRNAHRHIDAHTRIASSSTIWCMVGKKKQKKNENLFLSPYMYSNYFHNIINNSLPWLFTLLTYRVLRFIFEKTRTSQYKLILYVKTFVCWKTYCLKTTIFLSWKNTIRFCKQLYKQTEW